MALLRGEHMTKPIIGVTPLYDDERESVWMLPGYMQALTACDALPVILPFDSGSIADIIDLCDGFLFTGGHDVSPELYNEQRLRECGAVNNDRDSLESELFRKAYEADMPVFGICRGIQLINALLGGALYQDLPTQLKSDIAHKMTPPYNREWHNVNIIKDTPLYDLLNIETMGVNSYHHQAIKVLSDKVKPMAASPDGIVEAIYCPHKLYIQAVQWHPEFSWKSDERQLKIVGSFVDACRIYKNNKASA